MHLKHFFILGLILPTSVMAFEPLNTDDAATIGQNANQIEQYIYLLNNSSAPSTTNLISHGEEFRGLGRASATPFTYTRGLSETAEAIFSATYYTSPRGNYSPVSNYILGMKWRFYGDGKTGWGFAAKPSIVLPASTSQQQAGIGLAAVNYEINLIGSYYWKEVQVHSNLSYARNPYNTNYSVSGSNEPLRINVYTVSVAPVWVVNARWRLALDLGIGTNAPSYQNRFSDYGLVAAIYSLTRDIDLGISVMRSAANFGVVASGSGVNSVRSEAGVTWRF